MSRYMGFILLAATELENTANILRAATAECGESQKVISDTISRHDYLSKKLRKVAKELLPAPAVRNWNHGTREAMKNLKSSGKVKVMV